VNLNIFVFFAIHKRERTEEKETWEEENEVLDPNLTLFYTPY